MGDTTRQCSKFFVLNNLGYSYNAFPTAFITPKHMGDIQHVVNVKLSRNKNLKEEGKCPTRHMKPMVTRTQKSKNSKKNS